MLSRTPSDNYQTQKTRSPPCRVGSPSKPKRIQAQMAVNKPWESSPTSCPEFFFFLTKQGSRTAAALKRSSRYRRPAAAWPKQRHQKKKNNSLQGHYGSSSCRALIPSEPNNRVINMSRAGRARVHDTSVWAWRTGTCRVRVVEHTNTHDELPSLMLPCLVSLQAHLPFPMFCALHQSRV
jgi:hypothetical protein